MLHCPSSFHTGMGASTTAPEPPCDVGGSIVPRASWAAMGRRASDRGPCSTLATTGAATLSGNRAAGAGPSRTMRAMPIDIQTSFCWACSSARSTSIERPWASPMENVKSSTNEMNGESDSIVSMSGSATGSMRGTYLSSLTAQRSPAAALWGTHERADTASFSSQTQPSRVCSLFNFITFSTRKIKGKRMMPKKRLQVPRQTKTRSLMTVMRNLTTCFIWPWRKAAAKKRRAGSSGPSASPIVECLLEQQQQSIAEHICKARPKEERNATTQFARNTTVCATSEAAVTKIHL
mmetsp:Transcript_38015/g.80491  ORF Transcript_38015/g.80491 Transcript_38015/m.80491 type:complete len:293 (-) Transcript_38015:851-1729(-)